MSVRVIVSVVAPGWGEALPGAQTIATKAARAALRERGPGAGAVQAELSVVLADDETLRGLNRDYRGQDLATNVLAFAQGDAPSHLPPGVHPLGDVVALRGAGRRRTLEQGGAGMFDAARDLPRRVETEGARGARKLVREATESVRRLPRLVGTERRRQRRRGGDDRGDAVGQTGDEEGAQLLQPPHDIR